MLRRFITALLVLSLSTLAISAQQTKPNPDEKPRKVKQELTPSATFTIVP